MIDLLRSWAAERNEVVELVGRPEWLLGEWEQICLIWNAVRNDSERRAALAEIVTSMSVLPKEVNDWRSTSRENDSLVHFRRLIGLSEHWFTSTMMFDLIARNEHLGDVSMSDARMKEQPGG